MNANDYLKLKNDVMNIKEQLGELEDIHDKCMTNLRSLITIDNNIPENDQLIKIREDIKLIKSDIVNVIIPSINNKF